MIGGKEVQRLEEAVEGLETLHKLRSRLERCPNGDVKKSLQSEIDRLIEGRLSYPDELARSTDDISYSESSLLPGVIFAKVAGIAFLLRVEGSSLEISLDINNPVWTPMITPPAKNQNFSSIFGGKPKVKPVA